MPGRPADRRRQERRRLEYAALLLRVAKRPRGDCPTPSKPAYDRSLPDEVKLQARRLPYGGSSYDCRCGYSHNTTQSEDEQR